jgi:hypothetical protein
MKRLFLLLLTLGMLGPPAMAQSYYLSPDVPTSLGGTTYLPSDVVRNDAGSYSLTLSLPTHATVDSLHPMCSGNWLISVEVPTSLDGNTYDPRDVIEFNPGAGTYALFFDGAAAGIPAGSNVDAAYLNGGDSADLILSFDVPTNIGGDVYMPADLVRYSGGAFSWFFDSTTTTPAVPISTDVTGADLRAALTVVSFDVPTNLDGSVYVPGELVSWDGTAFASYYLDSTWPISSRLAAFAFPADPGRVPLQTLRLRKSVTPGNIALSWSASTSAGAEDYGVYEGRIGTWYSHASLTCSTGGALSADVTPGTGNRYYLVVPNNLNDEGSYGRRSSGVERPQGSSPCRALRAFGCP